MRIKWGQKGHDYKQIEDLTWMRLLNELKKMDKIRGLLGIQ